MSESAAGAPTPTTVQTELDGVVAVYSADTDEVLVLSQSASDIWRLLDGTRTEEQIVELLAARYDVASDVIKPDVSAMLATWTARGLLGSGDGGRVDAG